MPVAHRCSSSPPCSASARGQVAAVAVYAALALLLPARAPGGPPASGRRGWVADQAERGIGAGCCAAGGGLVAAAVLGRRRRRPAPARAPSDAGVVDWRGDRDGPSARVTVSPLVDIRVPARRAASDAQVFTVREPAARPTGGSPSLDTFDGQIWWSSGQLLERRAASWRARPTARRRRRATRASSRPSRIDGAVARSGCPAAYEPRPIDAPDDRGPLRRRDRRRSSSTPTSPTSDGLDLHACSRCCPRFTAEQLAARRRRGARRHRRALPRAARRTSAPSAPALAAGRSPPARPRPYDKALALQDYFRDGDFDLRHSTCRAGHSDRRHRRLPRTTQAGLLRAVRRHLRGDGPRRSGSRPGWRSASRRATSDPTTRSATTSGASTPTPGPRCTSASAGGCRSSRRPGRGDPERRGLHRRRRRSRPTERGRTESHRRPPRRPRPDRRPRSSDGRRSRSSPTRLAGVEQRRRHRRHRTRRRRGRPGCSIAAAVLLVARPALPRGRAEPRSRCGADGAASRGRTTRRRGCDAGLDRGRARRCDARRPGADARPRPHSRVRGRGAPAGAVAAGRADRARPAPTDAGAVRAATAPSDERAADAGRGGRRSAVRRHRATGRRRRAATPSAASRCDRARRLDRPRR